MNFIKKIILFIYNFIFIQYYPKSEIKIHKKITKEPIIIINGLYNLQISQNSIFLDMDIYNMSFLFNLLPMMNSQMNADFLYKKIFGGLIDIGKYSEYSEGIYPIWSEQNPISFFAHSYGSNVFYELCKIIEKNGKDPSKMISKFVLVDPIFLAKKSNYLTYQYEINRFYLLWSNLSEKYSILKIFYNPKNFIIKKNKIPMNEYYNHTYNKITINNQNVFSMNDLNYNTQILEYFDNKNFTYKIYVGNLIFDFEYILNNLFYSLFYILSSIKLNPENILVFDGMSFYNNQELLKYKNIEKIYSLGHFDLFFDINPFCYSRNKIFYFDILRYLRNKK